MELSVSFLSIKNLKDKISISPKDAKEWKGEVLWVKSLKSEIADKNCFLLFHTLCL